MNRRERLMATMQGKSVDRPAVSFYEINGFDEDPKNDDPFNIYNHPSWLPLIQLAREKTDRMPMRGMAFDSINPNPIEKYGVNKTHIKDDRLYTVKTLQTPQRTLTMKTRRDKDINTIWTQEHLFKDVDDVKAFLQLPVDDSVGDLDYNSFMSVEKKLGDTGIVLIDTPDPLCLAASLFDLSEYTVIAMTEQKLFHRLLEYFEATLLPKTQAIAKNLPGRVWRIFGPEYASPPYLPPHLFREYVCRYVQPMVEAIQKYGGFARIHSHGNLKLLLDDIVKMGVDGLDPIEPPPQGDVTLKYVRKKYGKEMVLFGNIEITDIENLATPLFAEKVKKAIEEGTSGMGRGFVLMPSAGPYGRVLSKQTLNNYEKMIEIIEQI